MSNWSGCVLSSLWGDLRCAGPNICNSKPQAAGTSPRHRRWRKAVAHCPQDGTCPVPPDTGSCTWVKTTEQVSGPRRERQTSSCMLALRGGMFAPSPAHNATLVPSRRHLEEDCLRIIEKGPAKICVKASSPPPPPAPPKTPPAPPPPPPVRPPPPHHLPFRLHRLHRHLHLHSFHPAHPPARHLSRHHRGTRSNACCHRKSQRRLPRVDLLGVLRW